MPPCSKHVSFEKLPLGEGAEVELCATCGYVNKVFCRCQVCTSVAAHKTPFLANMLCSDQCRNVAMRQAANDAG